MSAFHNAKVVKAANVYFDGRVTSRTIELADGSTKTLGYMLPGEYQFGTGKAEVMEILSGDLEVLLPGASEWRPFQGGMAFDVPADSQFQVRVHSGTDYCCSFID
jgi:uncharacterized protein YaiE (UPF0345 family)